MHNSSQHPSRKRLVTILVVCLAVVAAVAGVVVTRVVRPGAGAGPDQDIYIVHTNDVHCGVDDNIGYAGVKLLEEELETKSPYVTLVDAGDAVQGAPIGTLTKGEYIVDIMNEMGYDVLVPGNHEFDYGMDQFMHLSYLQNVDYVCCNFKDANGKLVFAPYRMETYGDTKVAYVGIDTPETFTKSTPVYFQDKDGNFIYSFCEDDTGEALYQAVQDAVDDARDDGADYVIAVGHVGEHGVTDKWDSEQIIAHTNGISAFISGHSHERTQTTYKNEDGTDVPVTQTGTKLEDVGVMQIHTDGSITCELVDTVPKPDDSMGLDYVTTEDGLYRDAKMSDYIQGIEAKVQESMSQQIGSTAFDLVATDASGEWLVRSQETNLGDLLSDAFRVQMGTDVGFVNGGGIRADIKAGPITYNDAYTVQPFNNMMCTAEVTGQQIKDLLERGAASLPEQDGNFLHVSGVTYTIDASVPSSVQTDAQGTFTGVSGEYRVRDIRVAGEPLDLGRTYTVASYNYYLKNGGDGGIMSGKCTLLADETLPDVDCLAQYIESLGGSVPEEYRNPAGQGRITIVGR